MSLLPHKEDRIPLLYFVSQMLVLSFCACWLPLLTRAFYLSWVILGVAYLVEAKASPALPRTFSGNLLRILKAHLWPLFMAKR